jgi:hypothetical protein
MVKAPGVRALEDAMRLLKGTLKLSGIRRLSPTAERRVFILLAYSPGQTNAVQSPSMRFHSLKLRYRAT